MALDLRDVNLLTESVLTRRLLLRPWQAEDAPAVHAACQDHVTQGWLAALPVPYRLADAVAYVTEIAWLDRRQGTGLDCAMVRRHDGVLVGSIGLKRLAEMFGPEIGYWVGPTLRGHGYGAEATAALAEWGFAHGLHRVALLAAVDNTASCRTAEKAGFTRDGVLRGQEAVRGGGFRDMALYSRLATDPPGRHPS